MTEDPVLLEQRIAKAVGRVVDPELGGVTIGELGLVRSVAIDERRNVAVSLSPTFLGCPALSLIRADVSQAVAALDVGEVTVDFVASPVWDPSEISPEGRRKLAEIGIGVESSPGIASCPYCGSSELVQRAPVGSTSCRSVWWCRGCRTVVDMMRSAAR